ncbi:hypothetical protein [Bacteroides graminisolvens]|uniref:hypothetical protein n=1 Tax=Bacteroides graminisolvens TaxID=477666 RepID=UPI0029C760A6|nr:hypothetical protein [Bacteroides graminisolvens]
MLTNEITKVISLLKHISYVQNVSEKIDFSRNEFVGEFEPVLLDQLCMAGLLRKSEKEKNGSIRYLYELSRPLQQISICDIIQVTGGNIKLCFDDEIEIYDRYGMAGHRLGVANFMTCHFLSEINLAEIVLPDEWLGGEDK